jgi:hypothetical protein
MNHAEFCLQRLFRAARRARSPLPVEVPFALEARVLGAWRRGLDAEEDEAGLLPIVQKAFLCACAILVITAGVSFYALRERPAPSDEAVIVDSAIQLTLMQ